MKPVVFLCLLLSGCSLTPKQKALVVGVSVAVAVSAAAALADKHHQPAAPRWTARRVMVQ